MIWTTRLSRATPETTTPETPTIVETGTLRRRYLCVPGRITRWTWASEFTAALDQLRALPLII